MEQCCDSQTLSSTLFTCPHNENRGKPVKLITLKSLLMPSALERLNTYSLYRFCDTPDCPVVYFSEAGEIFTTQDIKVPVFQKHKEDHVPICYCFGWTRQRLRDAPTKTEHPNVVEQITAHIQAQRCGCEVNNPQGSCCLANIKLTIQQIQEP